MRSSLAVFFVVLSSAIYAQSRTDSILQILDKEIELKKFYYLQKEHKIDSLKSEIPENKTDFRMQISKHLDIFNEYIPYKYDSAYLYANKIIKFADLLGDSSEIILAKCNIIYCLTTAGLYMEAYRFIKSVDVSNAPLDVRLIYYAQCERFYYDIGNYNNSYPFYDEYSAKFLLYCDTALLYINPEDEKYERKIAARYLRDDHNIEDKIKLYLNFLKKEDAEISSVLGNLYKAKGDTENAVYYLALSGIQDTRTARRENTSKKDLAVLLYEMGDINRASKYIHVALEDANFYDARHRQLEINSILPIIEKAHLEIVENNNKTLILFLVLLSFLSALLIGTSFVIYKQIKSLQKAKWVIQNQLSKLSVVNENLQESNEIKDQYIIQALYGKSDFLDIVENLLKKIGRKIMTRQYDDINSIFKDFNLKKERENIFAFFDQAFLKLFPNFIEEYNKLFKDEDHVSLNTEGNLPPEVRIFALIRLGICSNERIATFLNLTINTIYVYKTKIKSKSIVPNEEFENKIMQIKKH